MFHMQSPGARSNRHQRLPNGVNTTGPLQRGYAQQALHAGANNAANHGARQGHHAINPAPDDQQLGVWEHFDHAPTPGATIEHNPLPRRTKLRCPIHAGPNGHQKCRYGGSGFPTMLKVREHVAWYHPSLCPSCQRHLRGPSSWNAHKKARLGGKDCPAAADCNLDELGHPLWHSTAVLDDFHRRRPVMENNSEAGAKIAWGMLYRQLQQLSEHDPVPNPLHDYGSSVQSPSSVAASPSPAPPPAYSPVDPFSPSSFGNIDETMFTPSRTPMDVDVETGASNPSDRTALAGNHSMMHDLANAVSWNSSLGSYPENAYHGSNHPAHPAPQDTTMPGIASNADEVAAIGTPATLGNLQVAYNAVPTTTRDLGSAVAGPSSAAQVAQHATDAQTSFAHSNDAVNRPSPAWHIVHAQEALRAFPSPEIGTALQHLQCALIRSEEIKADENYWQGQAERAMRVNREIAARLNSAIGVQYSTQILETNALEDLPLVEGGLRSNVETILRWLNSA